jgi:hypothetical protein
MANYADIVEIAAKAMYEHQVQRALEAISKLSLDLSRIRHTFEDVLDETDRSCAITIFALIDEIISELFLFHINPGFEQRKRRLFDEFGLLPTASRRIQMLFALNWIKDVTFHDLNLLRKIRNDFAHRSNLRSFGASPIKGYLTSFKSPGLDILDSVLSVLDSSPDEIKPDPIRLAFKPSAIRRVFSEKLRFYFLFMSNVVLRNAILEIIVMPTAIQHHIDYRSIMGVPDTKGILRDVHMVLTNVLIEIVVKMNDLSDPTEQ